MTDDLITDITLRLRSGMKFVEMSESTGWMETPMPLYYGVMQCVGAVTRALFEWDAYDLRSHGIAQRDGTSGGDLRVQPRGAFPRAMVSLTLLSSTPGPFDRLFALPGHPPANASDFVVNVWSFEDLLEADIPELTMNYIENAGLRELVGRQNVANRAQLARDLMVAFTASIWARYHPAKWMDLQYTVEGVQVEDCFNRCRGTLRGWLSLLRVGPTGPGGPSFEYHTPPVELAKAWLEAGKEPPPNPDW